MLHCKFKEERIILCFWASVILTTRYEHTLIDELSLYSYFTMFTSLQPQKGALECISMSGYSKYIFGINISWSLIKDVIVFMYSDT